MTDVVPQFSWTLRDAEGFVVVDACGELDVYTAPTLRDALIELIDETAGRKIAIDLRELTFLDSTGIGLFIAAQRRAAAKGIEVVLTRPRPSVAKALQITGVEKAMTVLTGDDAP